MSFLGAVTNEIKGKIPGLSLITGLAKDPIGAIFGKHSQYKLNPWHPPGAWRGPEERRKWEQQRAALGYPPYTNEMGNAFKAWQKQGGSVANFVWSPGVLQKTSPVMPGGAVVSSTGASYAAAGAAAPGSGRTTTRRRRRDAGYSRARKGIRKRIKKRSKGRRMTALQRKYFGKRRKRRRR